MRDIYGLLSDSTEISMKKYSRVSDDFLQIVYSEHPSYEINLQLCGDYPFTKPDVMIDGIEYRQWLACHIMHFKHVMCIMHEECPCCVSVLHPEYWSPQISLYEVKKEIGRNIRFVSNMTGLQSIKNIFEHHYPHKDMKWFMCMLQEFLNDD